MSDKITKLEHELSCLQKAIEAMRNELERIKDQPVYPDWIIEGYLVHGDGGVRYNKQDYKLNLDYYLSGRLFKTKEEAETFSRNELKLHEILQRIKVWNAGWVPDWSSNKPAKWTYLFDSVPRLQVCYLTRAVPDSHYFKSKDIGQQLIKEFSDDMKPLVTHGSNV